jgi:dTDP-4-dehydrorhamnose reductase
MKILVTGSLGQLGSEIKELSAEYSDKFQFSFKDVQYLDITDFSGLKNFINENKPDYIINCAAYTQVDKAEQESEKAFLINQTGVKNLAQVCKNNKIRFIHISTDYVFDGKNHKPYSETDKTNPESLYGHSKLAGELEVLKADPEYLIIRTSWLYSVYGLNFVKTMIRMGNEKDQLSVVYDQVGSPTNAEDLADAILKIIYKVENKSVPFHKGIYHYSNEGVCSWYDFALMVHELSDIKCNIKAIETKDYPTPASRPHFSVLNKSRIKEDFGLEIPHWKDALERCIQKIFIAK